jgi:hypothetical protein
VTKKTLLVILFFVGCGAWSQEFVRPILARTNVGNVRIHVGCVRFVQNSKLFILDKIFENDLTSNIAAKRVAVLCIRSYYDLGCGFIPDVIQNFLIERKRGNVDKGGVSANVRALRFEYCLKSSRSLYRFV